MLQDLSRISEESFRHIIEKSTDGMLVVDSTGVVQFINPAVERIFERPGNEIIGKHFDFHLLVRHEPLVESPSDGLSLKYIGLLSKTGKTTELELSFKADLAKLVEMRVVEMRWENSDAYMVVFHDITTLMRLQRLKAEIFERERVAKLKDEFISTVSHELRTPLAIVKCAVGNMQDGVTGILNEKQERIVRIAGSNVDRLTRLIDDILDLSRLEAGTAKIDQRPVNIGALLDEAIKRFVMIAGSQKINFVTNIPAELPTILADIEKITQVIDNLLSNAIRFARSQITVSICVIGQSKLDGISPAEDVSQSPELLINSDIIKVSIIDDGYGIPDNEVGHLFNKFVQIDRPTGGAGYKGTGLGLAICKEIIELHKGKIWAESHFGDGAQFHFILPQFQPTQTTTMNPDSSPAAL